MKKSKVIVAWDHFAFERLVNEAMEKGYEMCSVFMGQADSVQASGWYKAILIKDSEHEK